MKLVGSITENQFRTELDRASQALTQHSRFCEVLLALGIPKGPANTSVVIEFFPDGSADFLRLLLSDEEIVAFYLPWVEAEPIHIDEVTSLSVYAQSLTRINQIKLAVAQKILK